MTRRNLRARSFEHPARALARAMHRRGIPAPIGQQPRNRGGGFGTKRSTRIMIEINWAWTVCSPPVRRLAYRTLIVGKRRVLRVTQTASSANIIVIGAGVVGCSLAFHLARGGRSRAGIRQRRNLRRNVGTVGRRWSGCIIRSRRKPSWPGKVINTFATGADIVGGKCGFVETGFAVVVDERKRRAAAHERRDAPARRRRYSNCDRG